MDSFSRLDCEIRLYLDSPGGGRGKGTLQGAVFPTGFTSSILGQQLLRPLGEHPANLPPLAFDASDLHVVVARRLVPHPSDHRRLGPLLDRDAFRAGDGAAAHRRGMFGDGFGQPLCEIGVIGMEVKKCHDGPEEILDVNLLGLLPPLGIRLFAFGVGFGGAFDFEFGANPFDRVCRCPDAAGEDFAAFLLLDDPMLARGFDSPGQGGITGRKQDPTFGHAQDLPVCGSDGVRRRPWGCLTLLQGMNLPVQAMYSRYGFPNRSISICPPSASARRGSRGRSRS